MKDIGLSLHSILKISELILILKQQKLIDSETYNKVVKYLEDDSAN